MRLPVKVADEVWVAAALLHREHPEREGFTVAEIVDRANKERLTDRIRPGVPVHAYQHCVANRRPNPGNYRMLYALPNGHRRLFQSGDDFHPYREGARQTPLLEDLPEKYRPLLDWYRLEYDRVHSSVNEQSSGAEYRPSTTLFDRIREIWAQVPEQEQRKLPTDGAACHDRYIGESR
jgi:hypothetical protein